LLRREGIGVVNFMRDLGRRGLLSLLVAFVATVGLVAAAATADACTRVTWLGPNGAVITGRTMDWMYSFDTHLYVYPQGLAQDGAGGTNSLTWTGKHGAVLLAGASAPKGPLDLVFDGMNDQGLAGNLLWLGATDFGPAPTDNRSRLSVGGWLQYVLTSFATVNEVVAAFTDPSIYVVPFKFGPEKNVYPSTHLAVSDAGGDSAIIEYLDGKPVIHHGRQYQVMTNDPSFDEQLALGTFWELQDRAKSLPGSMQSEDRFARASYYVGQLPQTTDNRQAVAGVFSVMRNASVPWVPVDPTHPNLTSTYWRTVADQTSKVYYFESTLSPNIVWLDLNDVNVAPGSGVRAIAVESDQSLIGNIDAKLVSAQPITLLSS